MTPKDSLGNIQFSDMCYLETYKHMEEFVENGQAKYLGVCNFSISQLENLLKSCNVKPIVNMIEVHPYFQNNRLVEFCKNNGVHVIAYSPMYLGISRFELNIYFISFFYFIIEAQS